ncbi:MAG TPA: type 4a pilus biogenesis protein PilO [Firmicutes bacterium]|nr:type 4a pilus biogenesis protein PilO [Bacillota bacterium]
MRLITWGFMVVVIVMLYKFIYEPQVSRRNTLELQIQAARSRVSRLAADRRHLGQLKAELAEAGERLSKLESLLPLEDEVPALLRGIDGARRSTQVSLNSITLGVLRVAGSGTPYGELPITIVVEGTYSSVTAFLDELRSLEGIMAVRRLDISSTPEAAEDSKRSHLSVSIDLVAHVRTEARGDKAGDRQ